MVEQPVLAKSPRKNSP